MRVVVDRVSREGFRGAWCGDDAVAGCGVGWVRLGKPEGGGGMVGSDLGEAGEWEGDD